MAEENLNDGLVIKLVDELLDNACQQQASDIHIEPYEQEYLIRFRIDGQLHPIQQLANVLGQRMVMRLKVMSHLDIAERRLPQDGHFSSHYQKRKINVRVSLCPTIYGEKIVLRLLNLHHQILSIKQLGLTNNQMKLFVSALSQPQGLVLVTGPTGCGKTITLYSALQYLNNGSRNIITIEDPVEFKLMGINQANVNNLLNLNFSAALRAFLRQDPDIIMVGEIRDLETATVALQAAQTGHLVLSTLHANSALLSIIRLQTMGVPAYQIVSHLHLIIAQRLLRKLCDTCKKSDAVGLFNAVGCEKCSQGYKGRIAIFEMLTLSEELKSSILQTEVLDVQKYKHSTLYQAGLEKIRTGLTDYTELQRVVGKQNAAVFG